MLDDRMVGVPLRKSRVGDTNASIGEDAGGRKFLITSKLAFSIFLGGSYRGRRFGDILFRDRKARNPCHRNI